MAEISGANVTGKRSTPWATAALLLVLLPAAAPVAQTVRVPGTSVALAPPPGFSPSSRFPGFEHADLQASIMVTEVPGPFAQLTGGMTAAGLATRGMTLISRSTPQIPGKRALLLHVSQSAGGTDFLKWMLVAGDAKASVMIVATFPKSAEGQLSGALEASLLSAVLGATPPKDHFEGLPFRISPTPALKIAGRMSNLLVLSESGNIEPQGPQAAVFVVGSSLAPVALTDLKAFAATRARQTKQLKGLRITQEGPTTIDGIAAHELLAEGTDVATGRAVTLYQVVLPDSGGYILMQGMVASTRAAALVPEFRRVADTFRRLAR
ncbi:MAG TPA: hypothetical protein VJ813_18630 [Vicinamibacterales bacterium]|nr:hypothetical protein [Vicinamibacterales bacterium]